MSDFLWINVLNDAVKRAGITEEADRIAVPDAEWWQQLTASCARKACSNYGARLLREKVVHYLSQRLMVEDIYRKYGNEISKMEVKAPIFLIGLPRCEAHQAFHVMGRSGYYMCPNAADVHFPGYKSETDRQMLMAEALKWIHPSVFPFFQAVRVLKPHQVDDDLGIHLMCPQSVAWGLFHGLQDHMYKCVQEDQQPIYDYMQRIFKLWRWYELHGSLKDNVLIENNPTGHKVDDVQRGTKDVLTDRPYVMQSPLALSAIAQLHKAFPDMKLIWTHRALNHCIPSFCSCLAVHNTLYTGKRPTETQMATIGEQVVGYLGSGSEYAVDYLGSFPKSDMVHWHNRDIRRSTIRLLMKTIDHWGQPLDSYRRHQAISGYSEYIETFRPRNDAELHYFGLHEGVIGEAFEAYITQFEEYAFESPYGIKAQNYVPLANTRQAHMGGMDTQLGPDESHGLGLLGATAGHYLQDHVAYERNPPR
jgi:hypothetical protein